MITISRIRILGLFLGALLAVVPALTHAIGLGKLKVHSALDEPLNAEIPFTSLTKREQKRLKAQLATRAEFSAAGIDRSPILVSIKFNVAKRVDGRYFLQLQTDDPFREPFLHLLVYIEWAGGRLIREYSALIDPPYLLAAKPAKIEAPVTAPVPVPVPEVVAELPKPELIVPPVAVPEEEPIGKAMEEKEVVPAEEPVKEPVPEKEPAIAPEPEFVASVDEDMLEDMFGNQIFGPAGIGAKVKIDRKTGWPVDPFDPDETSVEPLEPRDRDQLVMEPSEPMPEEAPVLSTDLDRGWLDDEYHVQRGDTLWEIAEQVRPDSGLSVQQVVMAIYRSNRHAFFEDNVNNLKAGKVLKIPAPDDISEQVHLEARTEFQAHYDVWQEYKLKRASARQAITVDDVTEVPEPMEAPVVAKAKVPKKAKPEPRAPKKKTAKAKKPKAKPAPKPKVAKKAKDTTAEDLLKIVRANINKVRGDKKAVPDSEPRADAAREKSELADRIASTEASLHSREMETKEIGDRAGQVKQQIAKQKRLIELENAKLAQTKDSKAPVKPAAKPATKAAAKPGARKPVKPVRPAVPPPAPQPQKGFVEDLMDRVMSGALMLPVFVGVIALLFIGLFLVYMKRRKQASLEFEESILNSTMDSEASGDTEGDIGDTSFLSDFSQGGMGNISTDEVDPIAEAEVYLAYGRDEQAEEILRESIVKDPARHEVREKLLEIYHQRGDAGAFETLAEELYAALGGQGGEVWARVAALGKELNPDNPMFAEGGAPVSAGGAEDSTPTTADMDDMGDLDDMLETPGVDDGQATMIVPSEGGGADDALDFTTSESEAADDGALTMDEGLDMGGLDIGGGEEAPAAAESAEAEPEAGGDAIDFSTDFDTDDTGIEAPAADEPEAVAEDDGLSLDAGGIDFSMDEAAPVAEEAPAEEDVGIDMEGLEMDDSGGLSLDMEETPVAEEAPAEEAVGIDMEGLEVEEEGAVIEEESAEEVLDMVEADIGGLDVDEGESELIVEDGGGIAVEEDTSVAVDAEEDSELWDETATKLDLAKAYIDMGDAEGARSILDEVMAEGNDEQKAQASELASQIS